MFGERTCTEKLKYHVLIEYVNSIGAKREMPTRTRSASMLAPRNTLHSTPQGCVEEALRMLQVTSKDTLFDIGCGDGRVLVSAATTFGCHCVGIDLNPERCVDVTCAALCFCHVPALAFASPPTTGARMQGS